VASIPHAILALEGAYFKQAFKVLVSLPIQVVLILLLGVVATVSPEKAIDMAHDLLLEEGSRSGSRQCR
jgi:hypothetical protein